MSSELIPFGKYKGQPIEVLQQDRGYCDWLVGQDWLQTRFPELRTIIVNNFAEPTETPEHNALQAKALDARFVSSVMFLVHRHIKRKHHRNICWEVTVDFETEGMDVVVCPNEHGAHVTAERGDEPEFSKAVMESVETLQYKLTRTRNKQDELIMLKAIEDAKNADTIPVYLYFKRAGIELKPTLGDDYPAALRQIRSARFLGNGGIPAIVVGKYTGVGATLDQVRQMFEASGIRFLLVSEIEAMAATLP